MTRITRKFADFAKQSRMGLVAYITAGDPTLERTVDYVLALEEGGADVVELGVPFSDPLADGVVIQRASERALHAGATLAGVLQCVVQIRQRSQIPLVLFGYLNPYLRYGFDKFATEARQAGADGVLITDLSVEEAEPYVREMRRVDLDTIFLAAPTSTEERLKRIGEVSRGFVYAVSRMGVTGTRDTLSSQVLPLVERLRAVTALPLAAGFGISRREHLDVLQGKIDAAVVGSALVRVIEEHGAGPEGPRKLAQAVRELLHGH